MEQNQLQDPSWAKSWAESVGRNISRYRKAANLTVAELARECEALGYSISRASISKIEGGFKESIAVHEVLIFARALSVSPMNLLIGDGGNLIPVSPNQTLAAFAFFKHFQSSEVADYLGVNHIASHLLGEEDMRHISSYGKLLDELFAILAKIGWYEEHYEDFLESCKTAYHSFGPLTSDEAIIPLSLKTQSEGEVLKFLDLRHILKSVDEFIRSHLHGYGESNNELELSKTILNPIVTQHFELTFKSCPPNYDV